jgi:hypothetical protein
VVQREEAHIEGKNNCNDGGGSKGAGCCGGGDAREVIQKCHKKKVDNVIAQEAGIRSEDEQEDVEMGGYDVMVFD